MLRREGRLVNRKRVQRLYREEGLAVRSKGKKRRSQAPRPIREALSGPNERWSMDFVSDTLSNGRAPVKIAVPKASSDMIRISAGGRRSFRGSLAVGSTRFVSCSHHTLHRLVHPCLDVLDLLRGHRRHNLLVERFCQVDQPLDLGTQRPVTARVPEKWVGREPNAGEEESQPDLAP